MASQTAPYPSLRYELLRVEAIHRFPRRHAPRNDGDVATLKMTGYKLNMILDLPIILPSLSTAIT